MTQKDLLSIGDISHGRIDRRTVFADFLGMSAYMISNRFDPVHLEQRKSALESLLHHYLPEERTELMNALKELIRQIQVNVDCDSYKDLLGPAFMELRIGGKGQDFTPHSLCDLVSRLTISEQPVLPKCGYFTVNEPACGAGAMSLAVAERLQEAGFNLVQHLVIRAEDLDIRCVFMTYIQLSLYGIPAVVIHGDTLELKELGRWYTPAYLLGNWLWKEPMPFQAGRNPDDERLKMALDPIYRALRLLERGESRG